MGRRRLSNTVSGPVQSPRHQAVRISRKHGIYLVYLYCPFPALFLLILVHFFLPNNYSLCNIWSLVPRTVMTESNPIPQMSDQKTTDVTSLDVDQSDQSTPSIDISPMQYRKLIWKLDLHLLPPLFALWFVSLIDRINIGSANIFGIQKDLKMNPKSNDLNIALVIVLVGLITCEVPSNWLLKKTSPSKVLALESLILGRFWCLQARISSDTTSAIFTIGQGLITNFSGLLAMRFFIGVCEAGLIPGSVFLLAQ